MLTVDWDWGLEMDSLALLMKALPNYVKAASNRTHTPEANRENIDECYKRKYQIIQVFLCVVKKGMTWVSRVYLFIPADDSYAASRDEGYKRPTTHFIISNLGLDTAADHTDLLMKVLMPFYTAVNKTEPTHTQCFLILGNEEKEQICLFVFIH